MPTYSSGILAASHTLALAALLVGPCATSADGTAVARDGAHDFDFSIGNWHTQIKRLAHPLTDSKEWVECDGTSIVHAIWDGKGSVGETECDGPQGHLETMSLRLYDPQSGEWSLRYASAGGIISRPTALSVGTVGAFKNGRGEFYDTEPYNGKNVLVRNTWSNISHDSIHFEQAFSQDGGRSWEVNWIAIDTRLSAGNPPPPTDTWSKTKADGAVLREGGGARDFDFEFGAWKVHIHRLRHPLSGSKEWIDYDGTSILHAFWTGRANIGELEVAGPDGHRIEGLSLRLFNRETHTWSIYWANANDGAVGSPMIGEFSGGRGEFYDRDIVNGKPVFVRFVFSDMTATAFRFEQSFSPDAGKSWEVNWIATFTRSPPQ
jgi:hypothetical protein